MREKEIKRATTMGEVEITKAMPQHKRATLQKHNHGNDYFLLHHHTMTRKHERVLYPLQRRAVTGQHKNATACRLYHSLLYCHASQR